MRHKLTLVIALLLSPLAVLRAAEPSKPNIIFGSLMISAFLSKSDL